MWDKHCLRAYERMGDRIYVPHKYVSQYILFLSLSGVRRLTSAYRTIAISIAMTSSHQTINSRQLRKVDYSVWDLSIFAGTFQSISNENVLKIFHSMWTGEMQEIQMIILNYRFVDVQHAIQFTMTNLLFSSSHFNAHTFLDCLIMHSQPYTHERT